MSLSHPELHDLTALAYDMIEGSERDGLLEHLSECDSCRDIYDSYREEQSQVRDVIVEDARSGPAEAAALQKTLLLLAELDGEPTASSAPEGKLLRLSALWVAVEIAAVVLVAVGLFFLMKPEGPRNNILEVAKEIQAPVDIDSGTVLVGTDDGAWQPADAIPSNEWVMAGDSELSFSQIDGLTAKATSGTVFRISIDEARSGEPIIYVLNGDVSVKAASIPVALRAGDKGFFYAMPGATLAVSAQAQEQNWSADSRLLRRLKALQAFEVKSESGEVVYTPLSRASGQSFVLLHGERVKMSAEGSFLFREGPKNQHASAEIQVQLAEVDELRHRLTNVLNRLQGQGIEFMTEIIRADLEGLRLKATKRQDSKSVNKTFIRDSGSKNFMVIMRDENKGEFTVILTSDGVKRIIVGKTREEIIAQLPEELHGHVLMDE